MSHQHIDLGALLHPKGYRLTSQRRLILDAVCEARGHATPDAIWRRVQKRAPDLHRATVYRALEFLCEVGLVTSTLTCDGHLAYEMAGEEQHHHLVCRACGGEKTIPHALVAPMLTAVREAYGFQVIERAHLSLFGVCGKCRSQS